MIAGLSLPRAHHIRQGRGYILKVPHVLVAFATVEASVAGRGRCRFHAARHRLLQPQRDDLIQQPLPVLRPKRRPADRLTIELCSRPAT